MTVSSRQGKEGDRTDLVWCIDSPGFGGAERDLVRVMDMLGSTGVCHHVAHGNPLDERLRSALLERRVEFIPIAGGSKARYLPRSWTSGGRLLSRFPAAVWIVWCHHFDTCRWLQQRLAWSGKPFVLAERILPEGRGDFRRSRLTVPLKRLAVRRCRAVAVPARRQVEAYAQIVGVSRESVSFIPNSRDVSTLARRARELRDHRASVRASLAVPSDAILLVNVGRLCAQKAHDVLIRSTALLRQRARQVHLCLVGDGPDREPLARLCREFIPNAYTLAGERADPIPYLAAADLFALPSLYEGLSGALIEAMAVGVPVVASDIPGNRELVEDGRTGLLFPVGSAEALADKAARLLSDPALASSCSAAALQLVREEYDASVEARLWTELVTSLVAGSSFRRGQAA